MKRIKKFNEQYETINEKLWGSGVEMKGVSITSEGIFKSNVLILIFENLKKKYNLNDIKFNMNGTLLEINNDRFYITYELNGNELKFKDSNLNTAGFIIIKNMIDMINGTLLQMIDNKLNELLK